jgi:myo-inositol-1-phosphate synthase
VVKFLIPYNGYKFGTENKKLKDVEGVMVPFEFTQRLEMPQGAFFAEFKVKDAKINQPIGDDVFAMPN